MTHIPIPQEIARFNFSPERHPLPPFLPQNARLLMLGSFPPPKNKWCIDFFYPNFTNDMWRILGLVFYNDRERFVIGKKFHEQKIRAFLAEKRIALWDTAMVVERLSGTASDDNLNIIEKINIEKVLNELPNCGAVSVTGGLALDILFTLIEFEKPAIGECSKTFFAGRMLSIYRMPSSSRRFPKSILGKAALYKKMFVELGIK